MNDDRITIAERYASATHSSDLTPRFERRTDADVLLAAGIAASGSPRLRLALQLYRMAVCGSTEGLWDVVEQADSWLAGRLTRGGNRPMPTVARRQLVVDTLQWWLAPTCGYCNGLGFVQAEDAARLTTVECEGCHGKGQRPLSREVPHRHVPHAEWLTGELDQLVAVIHGRMAKLLAERIAL